jgi:thiamine pyrophosphokinase
VRAILFINGDLNQPAALQRRLRPDDLLVAVDGGARHLEALGLLPAVLVGDLDSIDPALVERYAAQGVTIERHPVSKDQTDLELAIEYALQAGADEIWLAAATGGRIDQTLANLLILAQREWEAPLYLVEGEQTAQLLRGPDSVRLHGRPGDRVSAIPLSEVVTGIRYVGLSYPLEDATLELGSTRGVSNTMESAEARISIASGLLLVVTLPAEDQPEG